MRPRDRLRRASLLATVALSAAACGEARHERLELGGVTVALVERSLPSPVAGGEVAVPGDYLIEDGDLRVLVGGMRRPGEARGAILEAHLEGAPADDSIVLLAPRLFVGAASHAVVTREMYVVDRGDRPALRIEGDLSVDGRRIEVRSELTIARAGQALSMVTRVTPEDDGPLAEVRVGARIAWGGAQPWLPGVGPLDDQVWHEANWIARAGTGAATVFGFEEGPAHVRAVFEQHGAARFLSHTTLGSPQHDLGEDEAWTVKGVLAMGRPGTGEAVRRLGWARGEPFPEVLITLPYAPPGSVIQVRTAEGAPLIETRPNERGQALVPLTPIGERLEARRWIVTATAYGHAAAEEVVLPRPGVRERVLIPRGGRVLIHVADERTGAPMPARVRIAGVGGTRTPRLGPEARAAGAVDTVITLAGELIVPLAPGTYDVVITRGPEWTLAEQRIEVTETFRPEVMARLRHAVDPGDWVAADFHLHAAPSPDSQVSLADRVASLVAEGVRFAVPTDHNHVTDYGPALAELGLTGVGTVPGVEVTTWDPHYGHFNAFPFPLDEGAPGNGAPEHRGTRAASLFAALHAAGEEVVVQVNHPRMEGEIGYLDVMGLNSRTGSAGDGYSPAFDALEVWNGFDLARLEMFERVFEDWLWLLSRGRRVVATGNSDSHKIRPQWAGYPRTYVYAPGFEPAEPLAVVRALRAGRAFVTSGPFLEVRSGEAMIGDTVTLSGTLLPLQVRVRAPPWMEVSRLEVYVGPTLVHTEPVPPPPAGAAGSEEPPVLRFDGELQVPVRRPGFVVVVARGDRPMERLMGRSGVPPLAFTNPIWVALPRPPAAAAAPGDAGVEGDGGIPGAGAP